MRDLQHTSYGEGAGMVHSGEEEAEGRLDHFLLFLEGGGAQVGVGLCSHVTAGG